MGRQTRENTHPFAQGFAGSKAVDKPLYCFRRCVAPDPKNKFFCMMKDGIVYKNTVPK
jgi:hypothetical protein